MKVIDWESKGNVIRFCLGTDNLEKWWGDDWDDAPWDCNAGPVYDEYVSAWVDFAFAFDTEIEAAGEHEFNTRWTKEDMVERRVPILTIKREGEPARSIFMGDSAESLWSLEGFKAWGVAPL